VASQLAIAEESSANLEETDSWHKAAAIVTIKARDFDAATELAKREARRTIDVLNFFGGLGRASFAHRREQAFLLFAIALETVTLCGKIAAPRRRGQPGCR
jgi:hypothetical protein